MTDDQQQLANLIVQACKDEYPVAGLSFIAVSEIAAEVAQAWHEKQLERVGFRCRHYSETICGHKNCNGVPVFIKRESA